MGLRAGQPTGQRKKAVPCFTFMLTSNNRAVCLRHWNDNHFKVPLDRIRGDIQCGGKMCLLDIVEQMGQEIVNLRRRVAEKESGK